MGIATVCMMRQDVGVGVGAGPGPEPNRARTNVKFAGTQTTLSTGHIAPVWLRPHLSGYQNDFKSFSQDQQVGLKQSPPWSGPPSTGRSLTLLKRWAKGFYQISNHYQQYLK